MQVVGVDIGFGFTKATNGRKDLVFKSIFGEASEIQYREQLLGAPSAEDHIHVSVNHKPYFVGELAERQSGVRSFTLDQDQLITNFSKIMAMAALSHLADPKEPIRLITGLPISYYRRHRDALTSQLSGKHELVRFDAAGNEQPMSVNVSHTRVVPQPFGSLFGLMLNNMAEIGDRRFVQEKVGIIDVGFRTCDYTISDRTRYSERGSRTTDSGIAQAFGIISGHLREATGVNIELYRLYDGVAKGSIKIRGRQIDLKPIVDEAFSKLATAVATEVDRLWADDWDIDLIIVTGGGGAVLGPHLTPLLNGEVHAIDPATDARLNNVRGYWKYGTNVWSRESRATPRDPV